MYRCTECGCEYENKPDFCDCGNDEFIEIKQSPLKEQISNEQTIKPKAQPASVFAKSIKIEKKSFSEQNPLINNFFKSLDPISLIIFVLCIILAIIVIVYNPTNTKTQKEIKSTIQTSNKNIPNIDKIWDNSVPVINKKEENIPQTVKPKEQIIKQPVVINQKPVQKIQKTINNKNTSSTKQSANTTQKKTTTIQSQKKADETKNVTKQKQVNSLPDPQQQQTKISNIPTSQPQVQQINVIQTETAQEIARKKAQEQAELNNYKAALRNTIGQKIDFTRVIGDGTCVVSFKVDSTGKLISRAFTKQSDNITLNDAVYAAVMSTPRYNAPPSSYNSETMSLTIKFYNGNFEISIK